MKCKREILACRLVVPGIIKTPSSLASAAMERAAAVGSSPPVVDTPSVMSIMYLSLAEPDKDPLQR